MQLLMRPILSNIVVARIALAFGVGMTTLAGACASPILLYWADNPGIELTNTDTSTRSRLVADAPSASGIDVAGGQVYWTDVTSNEIRRVAIGGGASKSLVSVGVDDPEDIAVYEPLGKMYWTDSRTRTISVANLDGSNVQTLINTGSIPAGITIDRVHGRLYWTEVFRGVLSANLDGSDVRAVVYTGSSSAPVGIAIHYASESIYWTDNRLDTIERASMDGLNSEVVVKLPNFELPVGIAIDEAEAKLYWTANGPDELQRSNLDGSDLEVVLSGLTDPLYLAIMRSLSPQ